MTAWDRVFTCCARRCPDARYHRGKELRRVEQSGQGVTAHFADGSTARGRHPGRRRRHPLDGAPAISPRCRAALCRLHGVARAGGRGGFPPALHAAFFEDFSFCLPDNEQMLGYPVAGPDNDLRVGTPPLQFRLVSPGERRARTAAPADRRHRPHAHALDPAAADRARCRRADAREAAQVLAPQFNAMLSLCTQPFLQPIYDLEVPHMAFGRVAILGDAAFVARPHVGAGVAKAARGCADAGAVAPDECRCRGRAEAIRGRAHSVRASASSRVRVISAPMCRPTSRPTPSVNTPHATARLRRC